MAKLILSDIQNLSQEDSAVISINTNSAATEVALENTLSRDGTTPNSMNADLDMNSNRILNLPQPVDNTEPVRLVDIQLFEGINDAFALQAAVDSAESSANDALDSAELAELWATEAEDVPVDTAPDRFSAMHWAIKANDSATIAQYREVLTADKIWYCGLSGDDETGDGTIGNPWYSVHRTMKYILSGVDTNGFAPVVMLEPGLYTETTYPGGLSPIGFLTWGGFPSTPTVDVNIVDNGGALVELAETVIGRQISGGQSIRLCSAGSANRTGDDCIIALSGASCISVLQRGTLILASLTLVSTLGPTIYATQGGTIELGPNVVIGGGIGAHLHADNGGQIINTGNLGISGSGAQYHALASGAGSIVSLGGSINFQHNPGTGITGPHHFNTSFVGAIAGGQINFSSVITEATAGVPSVLSNVTKKFTASTGGGIRGATALNNIGGGGPNGTVDAATFAWSE